MGCNASKQLGAEVAPDISNDQGITKQPMAPVSSPTVPPPGWTASRTGPSSPTETTVGTVASPYSAASSPQMNADTQHDFAKVVDRYVFEQPGKESSSKKNKKFGRSKKQQQQTTTPHEASVEFSMPEIAIIHNPYNIPQNEAPAQDTPPSSTQYHSSASPGHVNMYAAPQQQQQQQMYNNYNQHNGMQNTAYPAAAGGHLQPQQLQY
mmetsp:Transcript_7616/g.20638  ORF Transcript_7616/g.20638 Transcript_7616/m.20638 type:complete len:208 (-) Transcript_7616:288-911(-)|eukprot:CAMPEP_0198121994 /NCGR_PEP_ID=MMETSP1442-20131203/33655_1 /TAXON_ID= /ORGANISM="Craspedostauros australis, Strain CCMP3328" /LENGTH=207 /DNA_ID=CAMNT_0043780917 /DNA_START=434 /DNA_END=1057 /DNA_ORIENTATION=-